MASLCLSLAPFKLDGSAHRMSKLWRTRSLFTRRTSAEHCPDDKDMMNVDLELDKFNFEPIVADSPPVIILLPDGTARMYAEPVAAADIQNEFPTFLLCCDRSLPQSPSETAAGRFEAPQTESARCQSSQQLLPPGATCFLVPRRQSHHGQRSHERNFPRTASVDEHLPSIAAAQTTASTWHRGAQSFPSVSLHGRKARSAMFVKGTEYEVASPKCPRELSSNATMNSTQSRMTNSNSSVSSYSSSSDTREVPSSSSASANSCCVNSTNIDVTKIYNLC